MNGQGARKKAEGVVTAEIEGEANIGSVDAAEDDRLSREGVCPLPPCEPEEVTPAPARVLESQDMSWFGSKCCSGDPKHAEKQFLHKPGAPGEGGAQEEPVLEGGVGLEGRGGVGL